MALREVIRPLLQASVALAACFSPSSPRGAAAQQISQENTQTAGACSPITGQIGGNLTITCSGLSTGEVKQITDILNKILSSQVDPKLLLGKVDEALSQLTHQSVI